MADLAPQGPQQNQSENAAGAADAIEASSQRISEIRAAIARTIDAIEKGVATPVDVAAVETATREIAALYARMASSFMQLKDFDRAAICYEAVLQLDPESEEARENLTKIRTPQSTTQASVDALLALVEQAPHNAQLRNKLGKLYHAQNQKHQALLSFYEAHRLDPKDANSLYWIAAIEQERGNEKEAHKCYIRAVELDPLVKTPANKTPPDFTVLSVFAPFTCNTPTDYLMTRAPFAVNTMPLFAEVAYDAAMLKKSGAVVFNCISDADHGEDILALAQKLVDRIGLPVVNPPEKILNTTRENIARLLKDVPRCRLAQVVKHTAGEDTAPAALSRKIPFPMPVLVRPTGTHGGEGFEQAQNPQELQHILDRAAAEDHYIIEYVDYQSDDGYFRKYRFIFAGDKILPYHLAIGNDWKVHHVTTDMAHHDWMQAEEKAFLEHPGHVFPPALYDSMRAIRAAVGLDYFGIDCAIDRAGNLVVFEANASMLVHAQNEDFPYKTPFVQNIKQAFGDMLTQRVPPG